MAMTMTMSMLLRILRREVAFSSIDLFFHGTRKSWHGLSLWLRK
jgi:hypothetical protein